MQRQFNYLEPIKVLNNAQVYGGLLSYSGVIAI